MGDIKFEDVGRGELRRLRLIGFPELGKAGGDVNGGEDWGLGPRYLSNGDC